MEDFQDFVTEAHARGIALVCVQMPFYSGEKLATEYENRPGFGELRDFNEHVKDGYFDKLHVLFFNFMNFPGYSGKPEYFQDEVHPKEGATLAVLSAMASDSRLWRYSRTWMSLLSRRKWLKTGSHKITTTSTRRIDES